MSQVSLNTRQFRYFYSYDQGHKFPMIILSGHQSSRVWNIHCLSLFRVLDTEQTQPNIFGLYNHVLSASKESDFEVSQKLHFSVTYIDGGALKHLAEIFYMAIVDFTKGKIKSESKMRLVQVGVPLSSKIY